MATFVQQLPPQLSRHLTRRERCGERELLVFDGLFVKKRQVELAALLAECQYTWLAKDSAETAHSIRWKLEIQPDPAVAFFHDVDSMIRKIVMEGPLRLVKIYANANAYGENHYPHIDGLNAVTALYCANSSWQPCWQGETLFYNGSEPSFCVIPKPGRLIVFDGGITHRGSPPNRDCPSLRTNVVFKFGLPRLSSVQKPARRDTRARARQPVLVVRDTRRSH